VVVKGFYSLFAKPLDFLLDSHGYLLKLEVMDLD